MALNNMDTLARTLRAFVTDTGAILQRQGKTPEDNPFHRRILKITHAAEALSAGRGDVARKLLQEVEEEANAL